MKNPYPAQIVEIEGVLSTVLKFEPCEAKVVLYKSGTHIPRHKHSGQTLTIVLKGKCEGPEGIILTPGFLYKCGGAQYGPWLVYEDTYFLIIQKSGTLFIQ